MRTLQFKTEQEAKAAFEEATKTGGNLMDLNNFDEVDDGVDPLKTVTLNGLNLEFED